MLEMMLATGKQPVIEGNLKKVLAEQNRAYVLTKTGELYARGTEVSGTGTLGTGGVGSAGKWTQILTDVSDFWVSPQFTLMRVTDGRFFWCGRFLDGGATGVLVPTDISASFSALTADVSKIVVGQYGLGLIDVTGTLYTMGYNSNGWMFTGNTTNQPLLTKTTQNNVKDIGFCTVSATLYILKNDGSVYGSGAGGAGQLGQAATNVTTLKLLSAASAGATDIAAGSTCVFIKRAGLWYYMGANTNGQTGNGLSTGQVEQLSVVLGDAQSAVKMISGSYGTWALVGSTWYYTGSSPQRSGTSTRSVVPWNATQLLSFAVIPVTGYPIYSDPVSWGTGGASLSYMIHEGYLYGCGDAGSFKMLPGFGTTANHLGFAKLNNDLSFVE